MLALVKTIHTIIWAIMIAAILYVLYAGLIGIFNTALWLSIGLVLFEGVVLLAFGWQCPFTVLAMKYTNNRKDNFDIYLPEWLARHNRLIFSMIFFIGLALVIYNLLRN